MNSFIIARVNYCNSVLTGLPSKYQLGRIQLVVKVARKYCMAKQTHHGGSTELAAPTSSNRLQIIPTSECYIAEHQLTSPTTHQDGVISVTLSSRHFVKTILFHVSFTVDGSSLFTTCQTVSWRLGLSSCVIRNPPI